MTKLIGVLLMLLGLLSFYHTIKYPDRSKYWKYYSMQRDILGGIISFLLGLYLLTH